MLIEVNDPSILDVMGLLQHLNTQELKDLLHDESRLETMIRDSQRVKQQESEKDMLLASNKSLAEYNLSWEPKINSGRQRLVELYQTAAQLDKNLEEKDRLLENQGGNINLDTALVLLQTSATQAEEESEMIAEKFLDGTLDVDTFIEEFQLKRKVAHLRKVKADKMKELISKHTQQQSNAASKRLAPAPPAPSYFNPSPAVPASNPNNPLPYPVTSPSNLPYPIFPPSHLPNTGHPYPVFPTNNIYPGY